MRYFSLIRDRIATEPFLDEIASVDDAWAAATGRQEKIRVQREAKAIPLRGLRKSCIRGRERRDVLESRWTTGSASFPHAREFISQIADELGWTPGRAKIVNLPPGAHVYPHIDRGEYYRLHARFHLVLRSNDRCFLRAGDELEALGEGELWWFDNKQVHEAWNNSAEKRIHLIFDLLPRTHAQAA